MATARVSLFFMSANLFIATCSGDELSQALKDLKSEQSVVRFNAARTLRQLVPKDDDSISALIGALNDGGAPFEDAIQFFGPRVGDVASQALVRIGERAVPALITALSNDDRWTRNMAAKTLAEIGPKANNAFSQLQMMVNDPEELVRWNAIAALAKVNPNAAETVDILTTIFRDSNDLTSQQCALEALFDADHEGNKAIPVLVNALSHEEADIISTATLTLAMYHERGATAVGKLVKLLESEKLRGEASFDVGYSVPVRRDIVRALGAIGPAASKAIPRLIGIARDDKDTETRLWAAAAIMQIVPEQNFANVAFKQLVEANACEQLAAVGDDRSIAILLALLQANDPTEWKDRHIAAIEALGEIGNVPENAISFLVEFACSESEEVGNYFKKLAAIEALGKIGQPAEPAIPSLKQIRDAPAEEWIEWRVSDHADIAIRKIQEQTNITH